MDMATPISQLPPTMSTSRGEIVTPVDYGSLLSSVGASGKGAQPALPRELEPMPANSPVPAHMMNGGGGGGYNDFRDLQQQQQMQQQEDMFMVPPPQYQPPPPPPRRRRRRRKQQKHGGIRGFAYDNRVELMAAALVVGAVLVGAPYLARHARFAGQGSGSGSINILGLVVLALAAGIIAKAFVVLTRPKVVDDDDDDDDDD